MRAMRARASWLVALGAILSVVALVQAHHRAQQGRCALLKWAPVFEALDAGEPIYEVGDEGYPTPPITLLVMRPFHAAGPVAGPLLWAAFKIALAWWIVSRALALAAGRARDFPVIAGILVLGFALRPILSDVLHGNLNLLVGATVASAAWEHARGKSARSGAWIGIGTALKATPALGFAYFAWKRDRRALAGALLGLAAAALVVPSAFVGWERNAELLAAWTRQMVAPYFAGRELTLVQTEHINQSLLGLLARLTIDSVAVAARPPAFPVDVRVNLVALGSGAFRALHLAACALVLAFLFACCSRGRGERRSIDVLGEFSMLALAMLFLSERSWKHHYVLTSFPLAFLAWHALRTPRPARCRMPAILGLGTAALAMGASGSAVLGARGSDLAEAYGAYAIGALALFVSCGLCLRRERRYRRERATSPGMERERGPMLDAPTRASPPGSALTITR